MQLAREELPLSWTEASSGRTGKVMSGSVLSWAGSSLGLDC